MRAGKITTLVIISIAIVGLMFISSKKSEEMVVDQKSYVNLNGMHYLEDFSDRTLLLSLPAGFEKVGYTNKLDPGADYYASDEESGLEVFQNSNQCELLYVKRAESFSKYTLTLALCSLLMYEGEIYIDVEDYKSNELPFIEVASTKRPDERMFTIGLEQEVFLGESSTLPRNYLETNDSQIDKAKVKIIPNERDFLCVYVVDTPKYYVKTKI